MTEIYSRLRRVHDYLQENGFAGDGENNLVVLDYPTSTPLNAENPDSCTCQVPALGLVNECTAPP